MTHCYAKFGDSALLQYFPNTLFDQKLFFWGPIAIKVRNLIDNSEGCVYHLV